MSNQAQVRRDADGTTSQKDKLASIERENLRSIELPNDLNRKLGSLDTDLDQLKADIRKTSKGVKASLAQLSDQDADLTSKVSETYRRLGELDTSYQALTDTSARITKDIKSVTAEIKQLAERSDTELVALGAGVQDLLARTDELAAKSKQTTQALNKSIKDNSQAMAELERQLKDEINGLAQVTRERDDNLESKLDKTNQDVKSQQARILKMQAVDEALERRASALELTAESLSKVSKELTRSTTMLTKRTDELGTAVQALQARVDGHDLQIGDLQVRTEATDRSLLAFRKLEKRHVIGLGASILVLLLALTVFAYMQNRNWSTEGETNTAMQTNIEGVQGEVVATQAAVNVVADDLTATGQKLSQLDTRVTEMDAAVHGELEQLQQKLVTITDHVDSINGRVTNLRPHRTFGNGSVINGPEWVAAQPAERYTVRVATVTTKQDLYKTAERYSHYLKQDLAYVAQKNGYALLLGSYDSVQAARIGMASLPYYVGFERPSVLSFKSLAN
ncbi:MAG: hypothetical protein KDG50_10755 [Chromatiales bacterium]|nr:hypothetical protein [Chromatiales bacterium]